MNYNDDSLKDNINKDIEDATAKYYYNSSTVMKYLRKVLNEINHGYMDSGLRTGFIMKRYIEKYKLNPERGPKVVLLCLLKDIGLFYQDDYIPKDNHALAAASSFLFLNYCSPLKNDAKPLFYYKAKYIQDIDNDDYKYGLLMTLINQIVMYDYQEYTLDEIEALLRKDKTNYDPEQVRNVIKLLRKEEDILEKLNNKTSLYIYETQNYILQTKFTDEELLGFINTTNFSFEFHNHETLAHTVTVAVIARALARKSRLPASMCEEIYLAGLVHDIGKIRVPKEVLCFPGRLEGDMLKEMQRHVVYTKEILEGSFSYKIVEIASNHHEKLDGSGYPRALRAIDLSIGDKIIAVADIASALYCKRSYKASFPTEKIIAILESDADAGKLDKRIVEHLVDNYDEIMNEAKQRETVVLKMYSNMKEKYEALKKSNVLYHFFDKKSNKSDDIFSNSVNIPKEISETTYGELDKNYVGDEFEVISTNLDTSDDEEEIEETPSAASEYSEILVNDEESEEAEVVDEAIAQEEESEEIQAEEETVEETEEIVEETTEDNLDEEIESSDEEATDETTEDVELTESIEDSEQDEEAEDEEVDEADEESEEESLETEETTEIETEEETVEETVEEDLDSDDDEVDEENTETEADSLDEEEESEEETDSATTLSYDQEKDLEDTSDEDEESEDDEDDYDEEEDEDDEESNPFKPIARSFDPRKMIIPGAKTYSDDDDDDDEDDDDEDDDEDEDEDE